MTFEIRPYHPVDLTSIYRICLGTGDSGSDGTRLYNDPDLLGHYYAAPYVVLQPELAFVLTTGGHACGYVLGARDSASFGIRCEQQWFPPLRQRYPMPDNQDTSADANVIRAIHRGHETVNEPAEYPAHLHIDILPQGQGRGWGSKLLDVLLGKMRQFAVPAVHLGVGKKNVRAIGFYEHYGFHRVVEAEWGVVFGMKLG